MNFKVGDYVRIVNAFMPDYISARLNGNVARIIKVDVVEYSEYPIRVSFLTDNDKIYAHGLRDLGVIYKEEELEKITEDEAFVGMI